MPQSPQPVLERPPARRLPEEAAYVLPMLLFLLFTWAGGQWSSLYPASYVIKTILVAVLMIAFAARGCYQIRWNHWWLGIIVGIVVVFQWVGMEKLLPNYPKIMTPPAPFNPFEHFRSPAEAWSFIAVRWAGAALLVPFMEELFWRDYLWRTLLAPNDFKLAGVGEWDLKTFLIVAVAFGAGVHFEWITAIVCGLIYGALLVYTRSLGACIIAHGVTNFLLGLYVLRWHDWKFW